jgi:epoxyqueuosine reductase
MSRASNDLEKILQNKSLELGFSNSQWIALKKPLSFPFYQDWLDKDYQGEMSYLKTHAELKADPLKLHPDLKSILTFTFPYLPHPKPLNPFPSLRIARYAKGEDYHFWLKEKLAAIAALIKSQHPDETFLPFVDSGPVLERDFAQQAALGWIGKNTCLIDPKKGSLFFICELLTSLEAPPANAELKPVQDFCGTCTRCLDVCPTGAIEAPKVLNATKCISYLTIESRKLPTAELRPKIGDWLFGCDLCQTVCPWNNKVFQTGADNSPMLNENKDLLFDDLFFLLTASGKQIQKRVYGTPLMRAGSFGLRRNALIVVGNRKLLQLRDQVQALCADERLGELAQWCLAELAG